ncbi:hypothetical protein LCGC14_0509740 [marine sediment metagenome]|uniref:Uncharacterized protein n=1 Tax=marine sediment metagenome TaxID=412755 RepID=A0A0F9VA45_9ZZZZ|nr:hypothetical protein [bacterium]
MKSETQIAEELIYYRKRIRGTVSVIFNRCKEHKASCERFLVFLDKLFKDGGITDFSAKKMLDLKQAIKLYNEVGI